MSGGKLDGHFVKHMAIYFLCSVCGIERVSNSSMVLRLNEAMDLSAKTGSVHWCGH